MCLAVPARLVSRDGDLAVADLHGSRVPVSTLFAPEAEAGDWVLIHAGFVIQRLDPAAARRAWTVLNDLAATGDLSEPGDPAASDDSPAIS
jgi:hydrogenase expression/formation protein HypC